MICLRTRVLLCELPWPWSWSQGSLLLWLDVSAVFTLSQSRGLTLSLVLCAASPWGLESWQVGVL